MIASFANNHIVVLLEIWRQNHYKIFILTPKLKKVINKKKKLANNNFRASVVLNTKTGHFDWAETSNFVLVSNGARDYR